MPDLKIYWYIIQQKYAENGQSVQVKAKEFIWRLAAAKVGLSLSLLPVNQIISSSQLKVTRVYFSAPWKKCMSLD